MNITHFRVTGLRVKQSSFSYVLPVVLQCLVILGTSCQSVPKTSPVVSLDTAFAPVAERVVIVSFDGLRPDAIEDADTPHLHALRALGTYSDSAQSVFPSITLVNHASMISGVNPAKHGIDWNSYVPDRGELKVPTVFDLAKTKSLATAMVVGKDKFQHLNRLGTVDQYVLEEGTPFDVATKSVEVLKTLKPQMMLIHFRHADSVGHKSGWMSSEQLTAIEDMDQAFGWIMRELDTEDMLEGTAFLISADHGGEGTHHGTDQPIHMTIPWIAAGAEVPKLGEIESKITQYDTAATAADLLELDIPSDWDGASIF